MNDYDEDDEEEDEEEEDEEEEDIDEQDIDDEIMYNNKFFYSDKMDVDGLRKKRISMC